jgi:hypothetical protein
LTEVSHVFGSDLSVAAGGDLMVVSGTIEGRQRVLRRILTIAGNYIWELNYGGGVPAMIGSLATQTQVEATIRAQMLLEQAVAQIPPPGVTVNVIPNGLAINISYVDAQTGDPVIIAFTAT